DYLQDHGGMVATIRALTGREPFAFFGDSADPARPRVRTLSEEVARVVRTRVVNPKWIAAMRAHGYKGAFELAATVDYLFGYDATAHVVEDWMYERVTDAYVGDPETRKFVELPVGATEDRLVGTLDIEGALGEGKRRFQPGLLHAADGGVLYVDEVNLLPDHLVDVLLDVAASGVNHVEREGISESHPCRFVLVGSMNPEEGELRPQLLDRFGLAVDMVASVDAEERAEAVRRRLTFDTDPDKFATAWDEREL